MDRMLLLLVAVSLAPLKGLVGQAEPATVLARLRTGQTLRVRLHDEQRLQARLAGVESEPPLLRLLAPELAIPLSAVDSLWVKRHATGTGALVGAIGLGAGSFIIGTTISSGGDPILTGGRVVAVALAGTAVGALLGAALGRLIPKWQLIHPGRVALSFPLDRRRLSAGVRVQFR